jgi:hypothetical protein
VDDKKTSCLHIIIFCLFHRIDLQLNEDKRGNANALYQWSAGIAGGGERVHRMLGRMMKNKA